MSQLYPFTDPVQAERQPPLRIVSGDGIRVTDYTGRTYVDAVSALWCASLGFSPEQTTVETAPFTIGDLRVLPDELRALRGQERIDLSLRDVKILHQLFRNRGKVVTRDMLFNECWGLDHVPRSRTLDQQISQLRRRIERDPKQPRLIRTVHGAGYRYEPEP